MKKSEIDWFTWCVITFFVLMLIYIGLSVMESESKHIETKKQEIFFQAKDQYNAYVFWCKINNRQDISYEMWQAAKRSGLIGNQATTPLSK